MHITKDACAPCSQVREGSASSRAHARPAQSQQTLPLLLPIVVPEQATLGTADMDKQGLPDRRSLPLSHKLKSALSYKVGLSPPVAKPAWLQLERAFVRTQRTVPFCCSLH